MNLGEREKGRKGAGEIPPCPLSPFPPCVPTELTTECLQAAADAHHIAGCLLVNKAVAPEAMTEAAKQLERTARYLRKMAEK